MTNLERSKTLLQRFLLLYAWFVHITPAIIFFLLHKSNTHLFVQQLK